jgi:aminopeptidase-like protein/aminoglycoside N3'-acetyltransferase
MAVTGVEESNAGAMTGMTVPYRESDLVAALRGTGIQQGDLVFLQVSLDALGEAADCQTPADRCAIVVRAVRSVLGESGTLVVPSYTFSFCRQQRFEVDRSPAIEGPWSESTDVLEYVRHLPGSVRSLDPIQSVTAIGPLAATLLAGLPRSCFGQNSLPDRLCRQGAKLCLIGTGLHEAPVVHHAEATLRVPYRYKKLFTGEIVTAGGPRRSGWITHVRTSPEITLNASRIADDAKRNTLVQVAKVGEGFLQVAEANRFYEFLRERIEADPWYAVEAPPAPSITVARPSATATKVTLPPNASMECIVRTLCPVARDIVSDGYDAALSALASQLPMQIHEYPTGAECSTWIVPEKWTCHEAWLETLDGRRLLSYADNPLHVVSYSLPFDGIVSREDLLQHLHVHDRLPEAVPFVFKYYERDWGLCCSRRMRDALVDPAYRVMVRSSFEYGSLKVGEAVVNGKSDDCIVLCAHLCHPGMANDDLTGVAVGVQVMRELRERRALRFTYRLLILPETIGSIAYLSDHLDLVPKMKGGLFLEMLGHDHPHTLQHSLRRATEVDECFAAALAAGDPFGRTAVYRSVPGNDERQFNGPGIGVPMLSLLRILPSSSADYPYREYHSSLDTADIVNWNRLEGSRTLVMRMIDTLERNRIPSNRFVGEVCCSRYGLHIDINRDPEAHRALFKTMDLVDGSRSIVEIAKACGAPVEAVAAVVDELHRHGLVEYRDTTGGNKSHATGEDAD